MNVVTDGPRAPRQNNWPCWPTFHYAVRQPDLTMMHTPAQPTGARIEPAVLRAVVKIEAPPTAHAPPSIGTGFIVSYDAAPTASDQRLFFLVTNKHVIGDWTLADGDIVEYRKLLNVTMYGGVGGAFTSIAVPLTDDTGTPLRDKFLEAQDPHVDVAIVSLNNVQGPTAHPFTFNSFDPTYLLPFDRITSWFTGLGDQVFALGYPLGITSARTSYPVAKAGYLATLPGEPFAIIIPVTRRNGTETAVSLDAKILVVDGLIVPGNSGGPIVLPSDLKVRRNPVTKALEFGTSQADNFVLGIISMGIGASGLTLCFSSDYILELIRAFTDQLSQTNVR